VCKTPEDRGTYLPPIREYRATSRDSSRTFIAEFRKSAGYSRPCLWAGRSFEVGCGHPARGAGAFPQRRLWTIERCRLISFAPLVNRRRPLVSDACPVGVWSAFKARPSYFPGACFTGPIRLGCSEGLCSLIAMYASRFRNCVRAERNGIGGARRK